MDATVEIDFFEKEIKLKKGQYILLCSDGLFKVVTDDEILLTVNTCVTPDQITQKLVNLANSRGGPDNTTVVVARIEKGTSRWIMVKKLLNLLGKWI